MGNERPIEQEALSALLAVNTEKMNFQQSICHQIRNWAMVLTGGFITAIWIQGGPLSSIITLHVLIIIIISLICHRDLSWHGYFYVFRDRAKMIENLILHKDAIDGFDQRYFETLGHQQEFIENGSKYAPWSLLKDTLTAKNLLRSKTDYIELYLIFVLIISLIVNVILKTQQA
jgi:hypothetical protein